MIIILQWNRRSLPLCSLVRLIESAIDNDDETASARETDAAGTTARRAPLVSHPAPEYNRQKYDLSLG